MSADEDDDWEDPPRTVAEIVEELREGLPWEKQADSYPVVVTTSESRIVWIEADSHDAAVEYLNNSGEWYEHLDGVEAVGHDYEIRAPEEWDWDGQVYCVDRTLSGPVQQCPLCHQPSHRIGTVSHTVQCPVRIAQDSKQMAWSLGSSALHKAVQAVREARSA